MKLTPAQRAFLEGIASSHVDYTTIGRRTSMAKRLEVMGYVRIVQDYFAYITDKGRAALTGSESND